MYVAGGSTSSGAVTNAFSVFDQTSHKVATLAPMPTARAGLGLVAMFNGTAPGNNLIYAVGGTNGTTAVGNLEAYDVTNGTWTELPPMPTPRAYLAVVGGTDNNIYAIGGVDASGDTVGTVEKYNTTTNTWSTGASLNTPRSHLAGTLVYLSALFVAGGQDVSGTVLNTTELFSLQNGGSWVPAGTMNTPRADFGISLSADGYLHAFGGRSTKGNVDSIEGWKISTNTWTTEKHSLPAPLAEFAATESLSGAVFIVGGKNGSKFATQAVKAFPPFEPAHSVTYFIHQYDEPYVNGSFAMDEIAPLEGVGLLSLGLLSSTNFTTFPAVSGEIESGGSLTVNIPGTLVLGVINGLTVSSANEDGSDPVVLGSVSSLLGLSGTVTIPITTPLRLRNKASVLNISTILGVDLNLGSGYVTVVLSGLNGKPSNPQEFAGNRLEFLL